MHLSGGASFAFWAMAVTAVVSSVAVITVRNIFHAALFLVVTFLSMAGLFVTLSADFVAVVEVLIYGGAISILLIFALMLTREYQEANTSNRLWAPGVFLGGLMLITLVAVLLNTQWYKSTAPLAAGPPATTTAGLSDLLFSKFVLPFEIAAILLLAAMIGAIVLARED